MHYMTASVLMSFVISNTNCLSEKFMVRQDNELNYSIAKVFVSCRPLSRYTNVSSTATHPIRLEYFVTVLVVGGKRVPTPLNV